MSEAFQVATIGVLAAILGGITVAILQPLWTQWIGKRSRLLVSVSHHPFSIPKYLSSEIDSYVNRYNPKVRLSEETKEKFRAIRWSHGLTTIEIVNRSKKSIDEITVHLERNTEFVADALIDGDHKPTIFGKVYRLGSLRAGGKANIILWTSSENLSSFLGSHRKSVVVSAKEYDKISIKFPPPQYIGNSYFQVPRGKFWITFWIIVVLTNLYNAIEFARPKK
jgi:hypothetical protein